MSYWLMPYWEGNFIEYSSSFRNIYVAISCIFRNNTLGFLNHLWNVVPIILNHLALNLSKGNFLIAIIVYLLTIFQYFPNSYLISETFNHSSQIFSYLRLMRYLRITISTFYKYNTYSQYIPNICSTSIQRFRRVYWCSVPDNQWFIARRPIYIATYNI